MTLRQGRELLAMPGPTNVPDAVLQAMHRPAIDIYDGEMLAVTDRCLTRLREVFCTRHHAYIYAANGHGAWEAALANVLSRGDTVLVLESGRFAVGWLQRVSVSDELDADEEAAASDVADQLVMLREFAGGCEQVVADS